MCTYKVVEKFVSINGEGVRAGEPAVFLRFKGCNLNCSYCDTAWANEESAAYTEESCEELVKYVNETGITNVTLTGGEPLLREGMDKLITALMEKGHRVELETNGSVSLESYAGLANRPVFTMDYKLAASGMEQRMDVRNFEYLLPCDTVKFVVGSLKDCERAYEIITEYKLTGRVHIYFSPVFGKIDPREMVDFLIDKKLNDARLQLQLHKFIWDPNAKGV